MEQRAGRAARLLRGGAWRPRGDASTGRSLSRGDGRGPQARGALLPRDRQPHRRDARPGGARRGYRAGTLAIRLQSSSNLAALLADVALHGLPADYAERAVDRYHAVTLEQARAAAARLPAELKIVVLGKAAAAKPMLTGLGRVEVRPFTDEP